jgi:hypothetical protein
LGGVHYLTLVAVRRPLARESESKVYLLAASFIISFVPR